MKNEVSIFFCSSNREKPEFENKIKENILKNCGDIPIISVTQKPIDFGRNICVGDDIGVSGFNFFRQTQIALEEAKTRFVISVEADCLYPPEYFEFIPSRDDKCYRLENLFVLRIKRDCFHKKLTGATHAQIVNREFYLNRLNELFKGEEKWDPDQKNFPKEKFNKHREDIFTKDEIEYFTLPSPVLQVKSRDSMRFYTACHEDKTYNSLPHWGTVKQMREKYL